MRAVVWILLAACGSSGGHGMTGDAGGDGGSDGSASGPALADRLHVKMIDAPGGVMAGTSSWRIWGQGDLKVAPVYTVGLACDALVGYTTTGPHAKVAIVRGEDGADALDSSVDVGAYVLRGLAADAAGGYAALLWDPSQATPTLHVQHVSTTGTLDWSADLSDSLAAPTDFNIGESRLDYGNGTYTAYYHVHGISGFAMAHEGDQLKTIDATTGAVTNGWSWGCSHSMSELLATAGTVTLAACVTDCYPGSSDTTNSIGGVYLDDATKVLDVDGGCNGSVAGELGSLAPGPSGWKLVFNAHQNAATTGASSYSPQTMNQDIGFVSIDSSSHPGAVTWLTTTPGNENDASVALWPGTPESYLVGWNDGTNHVLAHVAVDGHIIEGPVPVQASWGERDDPFRNEGGTQGDIVWAWFDSAGATAFHFARMSIGGFCTTL